MKKQFFMSFEKYNSDGTSMVKSWRIFTVNKWFIKDVSGIVNRIIAEIEKEESVTVHVIALNRV